MLAVLVGIIAVGLGIGKLGFVADLLSSEVQVGYMNGLAITIIVGQLPKLCGFSTDADSFVEEVREFLSNLDLTKAPALGIGLGVLVILLGLPRVTKKVPAVLVAVVGATVVSAALGLSDEISTVGTLPQGFPTPALPWTQLFFSRSQAPSLPHSASSVHAAPDVFVAAHLRVPGSQYTPASTSQ